MLEPIPDPEFIRGALALPDNVIAYHVGQRLRAHYPDQGIVLKSNRFELERFAEHGHCTVTILDTALAQIATDWSVFDDLERTLLNGWCRVQWQEYDLLVLQMNWENHGSTYTARWIIAPTQDLAEQFMEAVIRHDLEIHGEVLVFEEGYWSKNEELFESIQHATLDNLVLEGTLKEEITADLEQFLAARETYSRYGVPWKRGIIFIGPPGNGKTHMVKALINQLQQPCLYVKSFKSRYDTEQASIRAVFERARAVAPCLLVLEDLDTLVTDDNRAFFLNELDGFATNDGIVIIATTNHPEDLDPAIMDRPSRFDRKYHFNLPANAQRRAYLALWNAQLQPELRLSDEGLVQVARATHNFSYAYLKELVLSSMMGWIAHRREGSMDQVMVEQAALLRSQMATRSEQLGLRSSGQD